MCREDAELFLIAGKYFDVSDAELDSVQFLDTSPPAYLYLSAIFGLARQASPEEPGGAIFLKPDEREVYRRYFSEPLKYRD
jgi:hypothetical protein